MRVGVSLSILDGAQSTFPVRYQSRKEMNDERSETHSDSKVWHQH
ncbi:hypothetical protein D515_02380 [Grimontia indica]|uniref:Uncharacterized protein n=1 Tax=Grimontia indica TaxID=1056512 RepID=R1GRN9_9GAMM|nr:hypothetical protein D515_02380 [Grimontia indica]